MFERISTVFIIGEPIYVNQRVYIHDYKRYGKLKHIYVIFWIVKIFEKITQSFVKPSRIFVSYTQGATRMCECE